MGSERRKLFRPRLQRGDLFASPLGERGDFRFYALLLFLERAEPCLCSCSLGAGARRELIGVGNLVL